MKSHDPLAPVVRVDRRLDTEAQMSAVLLASFGMVFGEIVIFLAHGFALWFPICACKVLVAVLLVALTRINKF